jgi:hypothetical protein
MRKCKDNLYSHFFSYNSINHTCTVFESCTRSKTLELVEYIPLMIVHVSQYMIHGTYSTNSRVLDAVHDSITVYVLQYITVQGDSHLRVHFVLVLAQPSSPFSSVNGRLLSCTFDLGIHIIKKTFPSLD